MKTYKTHPMSLVFNILTKIAVVLTISVFVLIVGYVVIKGVPFRKDLYHRERVNAPRYREHL